ncbi:hypothetical protein BK131_23170 [Paenibacillus amylolyticus]|uniref:Uncharacterized protein n=1 Tax=Paenibacillus amylolyticus TaxID=1451 RepID=A0A1R1BLY0_PAEAM|nr:MULTISPECIES: hypothetical protein [Paenibacillus]OMF10903.1 hypothetical protein BK131_23170 [Paenibacillus amylolyticus]
MDKQTDLTRKLLMNSNSRGVVDEVVSFEENLEDTEYAEELTDGNLRGRSFWDNSDSAHEHEWNGRVETHEMFRRSYE